MLTRQQLHKLIKHGDILCIPFTFCESQTEDSNIEDDNVLQDPPILGEYFVDNNMTQLIENNEASQKRPAIYEPGSGEYLKNKFNFSGFVVQHVVQYNEKDGFFYLVGFELTDLFEKFYNFQLKNHCDNRMRLFEYLI